MTAEITKPVDKELFRQRGIDADTVAKVLKPKPVEKKLVPISQKGVLSRGYNITKPKK